MPLLMHYLVPHDSSGPPELADLYRQHTVWVPEGVFVVLQSDDMSASPFVVVQVAEEVSGVGPVPLGREVFVHLCTVVHTSQCEDIGLQAEAGGWDVRLEEGGLQEMPLSYLYCQPVVSLIGPCSLLHPVRRSQRWVMTEQVYEELACAMQGAGSPVRPDGNPLAEAVWAAAAAAEAEAEQAAVAAAAVGAAWEEQEF
jgi:hypothetical protein